MIFLIIKAYLIIYRICKHRLFPLDLHILRKQPMVNEYTTMQRIQGKQQAG